MKYNLHNTIHNFKDDFSKPKIVYSEIVQSPKFYLDNTNHFYPEATVFMITGSHLQYLVDMLNSSVIEYAFRIFYAGGGLGENGIRYKKAFLEKLPIPMPKDDAIDIDKCYIYNVYGFNQEEISEIEDF